MGVMVSAERIDPGFEDRLKALSSLAEAGLSASAGDPAGLRVDRADGLAVLAAKLAEIAFEACKAASVESFWSRVSFSSRWSAVLVCC